MIILATELAAAKEVEIVVVQFLSCIWRFLSIGDSFFVFVLG